MGSNTWTFCARFHIREHVLQRHCCHSWSSMLHFILTRSWNQLSFGGDLNKKETQWNICDDNHVMMHNTWLVFYPPWADLSWEFTCTFQHLNFTQLHNYTNGSLLRSLCPVHCYLSHYSLQQRTNNYYNKAQVCDPYHSFPSALIFIHRLLFDHTPNSKAAYLYMKLPVILLGQTHTSL